MALRKHKEIRAWLSRYGVLKEKILCERDHVASLRSIAERCTANPSFTSGRNPSIANDKFENAMIDIVEEERRADEKILRYGREMKEIEDLIGSVPEPREQNLLRYKYLQGMSWAMIVRKMVISEPYAYQIHSRALQSAGKYHSKS